MTNGTAHLSKMNELIAREERVRLANFVKVNKKHDGWMTFICFKVQGGEWKPLVLLLLQMATYQKNMRWCSLSPEGIHTTRRNPTWKTSQKEKSPLISMSSSSQGDSGQHRYQQTYKRHNTNSYPPYTKQTLTFFSTVQPAT